MPTPTPMLVMIALAAACILSPISGAQQVTTKLPQFEAVSIKPTDPNRVGNNMFLKDGYRGENETLLSLILAAYGVRQPYQIVGLPQWAQSAHYEIVAKVGESGVPAMKNLHYAQLEEMLRPVLEDRFSLRYHWEKRSLPAYTLKLSGKKASLKVANPVDDSKVTKVGGAYAGSGAIVRTPNGQVIGRAVPIAQLVLVLEGELGKDVVDATGLTGKYDFDMQYAQASSFPVTDAGVPDPNGPNESIQDGLSQIGLKLVPSIAELPVLVIDDLKPPSAN